MLAASHLDSPNLDLEPRACVVDNKGVHFQRGGVRIFGLSTARAAEKLQGGTTEMLGTQSFMAKTLSSFPLPGLTWGFSGFVLFCFLMVSSIFQEYV